MTESNVECPTWAFMPKKKKEALTWMDAEAMQKLLNKKQYATFADVHFTLAEMCQEGMQLSDDWKACLLFPYKVWGSAAITKLDEMRQLRDEQIAPPMSVKATSVDVMAGITAEDAVELVKARDWEVLRQCVHVLRSDLMYDLDLGQTEFLEIAEHYLMNRR